MSRFNQIIQNLYLRLEGLFGVFFKILANFFGNLFGLFAKVFGLTKSDYFLETNDAQGVKQAAAKEPMQPQQLKTPETPTTNRRSKSAKVGDYYLNMARDVKKN
jgi:hypothetical protein